MEIAKSTGVLDDGIPNVQLYAGGKGVTIMAGTIQCEKAIIFVILSAPNLIINFAGDLLTAKNIAIKVKKVIGGNENPYNS